MTPPPCLIDGLVPRVRYPMLAGFKLCYYIMALGNHNGLSHFYARVSKGQRMAKDKTPQGLDPTITTREILFTVEVEGVTPFLKVATACHNNQAWFSFASDEGPQLGGLGSAPPPLAYFSAAIAF